MKELLITSSVLILVLTALRFVFRNRISRRLQYALWLLVLARLLLPVSMPQSSFSVMTGAEALGRPQWSQSRPAESVAVQLPATGSQMAAVPADVPVLTVDAVPEPPVDSPAASTPQLSFRQLLTPIWLTGAGIMLLWFLGTNLHFARRLRRGRVPLEGTGAPLRVYVSEAAASPCLLGLFRPVIYLSPRAAEASPEALRHVLTHELCHYRHGDHIWSLLRGLCLAVYWFDPLVWLAAVLSRNDGELACDEAVIRALGTENRLAYGRTLVDMIPLRRTPTGMLCAATTMTSGSRGLKERINRIVRNPKSLLSAVVAVLLVTAICVGCTFTGARTEDAEAGAADDAITITPVELTEDVLADFIPQAPPEDADAVRLHYETGDNAGQLVLYLETWRNGQLQTPRERFQAASAQAGPIDLYTRWDRDSRTVEVGMGTSLSSYTFYTNALPEDFHPDASGTTWLGGAEYDKPYNAATGEEVILLCTVFSPEGDGAQTYYNCEYLMENPDALAEYPYAIIIRARFTPAETESEAVAGEISYSLTQVSGSEVTPLNTPSGSLASDILMDCMVKSAVFEAGALPEDYFILTQTSVLIDPAKSQEARYQVYRLENGMPVMRHGESYTVLSDELMARLEALAAGPVEVSAADPDLNSSTSQGVVLDYADGGTVIFHGRFGLYLYDRDTGTIRAGMDLVSAVGTDQIDPRSAVYADVQVSSDGHVIRMTAKTDGLLPTSALWIDTASWTAYRGPYAELRDPFSCNSDGSATLYGGSRVSILDESGILKDLQLVSGDTVELLFSGAATSAATLDEAIRAAVFQYCRQGSWFEGDYLTEAHWMLGTEESETGELTAYCQVMYRSFSGDADTIRENGTGGYYPMAFTFSRDETGAYQLIELWEPELGDNYVPSIQKKFPPELADTAQNIGYHPQGEAITRSLTQSCYAQAISRFGADMTDEIAEAISAAALNDSLGDWNLLYACGDQTLRYVFSQFLQGGQTGKRAEVMEALYNTVYPNEVDPLESAYVSPQASFDEWKDYVTRLADGNGVEWFAGNRTATLLLELLGYDIPARADFYARISDLLDVICSTPASASNPGAYVAAHSSEYATLLSYGDTALRYIFSQFLQGGQTDLRGAVMAIAMEDLLGGEAVGVDYDTGQDYFDSWKAHVLRLYDQNPLSYFTEHAPKSYILLDLLGYTQSESAADHAAAE